jgi:hypothetical protein
VQLGAIPMDRKLYIPLGDVLACYVVKSTAGQEPGNS